ncbi:MAG TPA: pilus assembly protein TadG-related protein [Phycisphaerae bacterium]|nr:pilus assembly protein TadG-related protein [Phycisphaerae bacterium]
MKFACLAVRPAQRRGLVVAHVVIGAVLFAGVAALAVDVGLLYSVRGDLQNAADAAALAGVSGYFSDAGLAQDTSRIASIVESRTQEFAAHNQSFRSGPTYIDVSDITLASFDFAERTESFSVSGSERFNAVQATTRRSADSPNGAVAFYFAGILGMKEAAVTASAIAAMDDRFAGYRYEANRGPALLPFTVNISVYEDMSANGPDAYAYDDGPLSGSDGISEVKLFPWKESGGGGGGSSSGGSTSSDGSGNFGVLDFGSGGASTVGDQIRNGITPADLQAAIGTTDVSYVTESGEPTTYSMSGQTGAMSSMGADLEARIGDVIGFFVHDQVTDPGTNASFRNIGLRFGRIMHVDLSGAVAERALVIQPVAYTSDAVSINPNARPTGGQVGRVVLVR